jgi:hypothetical protein
VVDGGSGASFTDIDGNASAVPAELARRFGLPY